MSETPDSPLSSGADSWRGRLEGRIDAGWADEIDQFESQLQLRKQDKIEEKVFAETRLRRGVYGQRYDNGQRHDGIVNQRLSFGDRPVRLPVRTASAPVSVNSPSFRSSDCSISAAGLRFQNTRPALWIP